MESKKQYIVLTPFFPNENSHVGSYIYDQVKAIINLSDYDVKIIKVTSFFSLEKSYNYKEINVRIFKIFDFPFFIFPGLFNVVNKIRLKHFLQKQKIENIKFIHSHVSYPSAYLIEDLECKKIIQHHGLDVLQLKNGRVNFIRRIQRRFLIRNGIKHLNHADINIGVSSLVLQKLRDYKDYRPKQEFVLYNGVDTLKFFQKDIVKNKIFTIGCIGNFWKIKGHITLIKSVHKIINDGIKIRLRLIGSGPTLPSCKRYVFENNLSKHILFENEVAHDKLNDFYNAIDLFVLPSYYEALGCVYLESWATNTPFISIKGQGISELIPEKDREHFMAKEESVESLTEKILLQYNTRRDFPFDNNYDLNKIISKFLKQSFFDEN